MKEFTIEQKAKFYDEAIKRGLDYIMHTPATEMVTRQDILEAIFPELKESEDERIRKVLIDLVKCNERSGYTLLNNVTTDSILAWLEKQGENPKWHEQDSFWVDALVDAVRDGLTIRYELRGEVVDWLKSLKQRIGG